MAPASGPWGCCPCSSQCRVLDCPRAPPDEPGPRFTFHSSWITCIILEQVLWFQTKSYGDAPREELDVEKETHLGDLSGSDSLKTPRLFSQSTGPAPHPTRPPCPRPMRPTAPRSRLLLLHPNNTERPQSPRESRGGCADPGFCFLFTTAAFHRYFTGTCNCSEVVLVIQIFTSNPVIVLPYSQ